MASRTSQAKARDAAAASGRELAVLANGPWAPCWYWRDDLERMQVAAGRFPDDHPSAQHRMYQPTEEWRDNPEGFGSGRVWRYRPAARSVR